VDGSHEYDIVREDIRTAERMLVGGGIVAFDDISTAHNPGSALAIWEAVLGGRMKPICITEAKLYGTWDEDPTPWTHAVREWAESQPDLGCEMHLLVGRSVPRIFPHALPRAGNLTGVLVRLDPLDLPAEPISGAVTGSRLRAREIAKLVAPPLAVAAYNRARAWRRRRAAT
jgi:hypothetical protein